MAKSRKWRGVRFLCYHSVTDEERYKSLINFTPTILQEDFRAHMTWLHKHQYHIVTMDDALSLLESGSAKHSQYICMTFDDGRLDNITSAWPILKEYNFSAHFFINSDLIGKTIIRNINYISFSDQYMSADDICTLVKDGASIGSHSKSHHHLSGLDNAQQIMELKESKLELEKILQQHVRTFAYPYSSYMGVQKNVGLAGYEYAFKINMGTVSSITSKVRHEIPRNLMMSSDNNSYNYIIMSGGYDFSRHYIDFNTHLRHFIS